MGIGTAELYNNLGLCCFFAQQYDMTLTCFQVITPYPTTLPPYHLTTLPISQNPTVYLLKITFYTIGNRDISNFSEPSLRLRTKH